MDEIADLQRQIEDLRNALDIKDQQVYEFVAHLAHELRTPLGAMLMWVHVLRLGREVDREPALAAIDASVRAQSKMIGDLLDVSRAMAGRMRLDRKPCDLASVLRSGVQDVSAEATRRGVAIDLDVEVEPLDASADALRVRHLGGNLVSYALGRSASGGRVHVRVTSGGRAAQLIVRDDGPSVGAEELAGLFKPFRALDLGASVSVVGLGLELPLARLVAELHGGAAVAESPGAGLIVTVSLPLIAAGAT